MENSFRLISEVLVYQYGNTIFISSPDDKNCLSKVKRKIATLGLCISICKEYTISSENFKIKLGDNFQLLVANDNLPGGVSNYYKIANLDNRGDYLTELFNSTSFSKGVWNESFEVAIDDLSGNVRFLCSGMPSFDIASNEMIRRMNCKIYKKTKKFIPGHRYDTEENTIIYLGKIFSHAKEDTRGTSEYFNFPTSEVYLYTEDIKTATKISEIFKNGIISINYRNTAIIEDSYKISVTSSLKPMVDCGEVLENDFTVYEDYIHQLLNNSKKSFKDFGDCLGSFFNVFKYSSSIEKINYEQSIIDTIKNNIKDYLYKCLCRYWDSSSRVTIKQDSSKSEKINLLSSIFIDTITDTNLKKHDYYKALLSDLGISLDDLSEEVINTWDPNILNKDFNIYLDNYDFRGISYTVQLRTNKSCRYTLTNSKVSDFIVNEDLRKVIYDIVKYTRDNSGYGSKAYDIINAGTTTKPLVYEQILINVENILNYYKEKGSKVPENLKYSIIQDKLRQISISVDLGGEVI